MTDNVTADPGSGGADFATDEIGSLHYPINKITFGALDSQTLASSNAGNVDAGTQRVVLASDQAVVSTNWNGTAPPIGAGLEATALRVTLATDSTGQVKLAAGTASIGTLGANSGVDIGDVDVTTYPGPADAKFATLGQKTKAGSMPVTLASDEDALNVVNSGTFAVQATQAGSWNITNISGTISLPTGAATETSLAIVSGAVSGGQMQVDIIASLPAGTNAIGKLSANSGVDIGDVDVTSQPARAASADTTGAALMTNIINDGTTALTPKFAVIDDAVSGNNTIVIAVSGKKIRVLSLTMIATGDVLARFEDGAGGTALTGQMDLTTNSGMSVAFSPVGHFETSSNTLLNLELDGAVSVDGFLTYIEV